MDGLSERIKNARRKMFLTQKELAELLGVAFVTVNRWENGKSKPSLKEQKLFSELCKEKGIELFFE